MMSKSVCMWLGLCLALASAGAAAQTVTGSGTSGTVPVFTGTSTIGNPSTPIVVSSSGNVGIGTPSPGATLDVYGNAGSASINVGTNGTLNSGNGVFKISSNIYPLELQSASGNVGIGTTSPLGALQVASGDGNLFFKTVGGQPDSYVYEYLLLFQVPTSGTSAETGFNGSICAVRSDDIGATECANIYAGFGYYNSIYFSEEITKASGYGPLQPVQVNYAGSNWIALLFDCHTGACANSWVVNGTLLNDNASSVLGFTAESSSSPIHTALNYSSPNMAFMYGNVGIGTTNPGQKLDVAGNIKLTGTGASIYFPDGSIQATAYTGVVCGGDYAESVDVTGSRTSYEPGDVLVIDPSAPGKFLKSNQPYSTLVTGIYSTKPGTVGRRQTTSKSPDEVPMAMMGIVPTKVTAENGPIKPGDLLVASSTLGRAMKGTDRAMLTGAVIGKALGNLDSGTGVIEVVVTLQ